MTPSDLNEREQVAYLTYLYQAEPDRPRVAPPVDLRPVDYNLTLTPWERLDRGCKINHIFKLSTLADTATLDRVIELLTENAAKNPFWDGGKRVDWYPPDELLLNDATPW